MVGIEYLFEGIEWRKQFRENLKKQELIELKQLLKNGVEGLQEAVKEVDTQLKNYGKKYPIGAIYTRKGHESIYALISWNGEIRFVNISNSHFWKSATMKSRHVRSKTPLVNKAPYLYEDEMESLLGSCYKDFEIIATHVEDLS